MAEGRYRDFAPLEKLPADWPNAVAAFLSPLSNLNIAAKSAGVVMAPVDAQEQLSLGVDGLWRYVEAEVDAAVPSGAAQTYDIVATTTANVFHAPTHEGEGENDETNYAFALRVVTHGTLPSGGGIAAAQKVGEVDWDGAKIIGIRQSVGTIRSTDPLTPTQPLVSVSALSGVGIAGATAAVAKLASPEGGNVLLELIQGSTAKVRFLANGSIEWVGGPTLERSGSELIVAGKLNVTETATLAGGGTSTTPATNDNTTKIATTAYVIGQGATAAPIIDGVATAGVSNLWARQDHVHPVDTSRAPAAGSGAITTVGVVTAGTWQATPITTAFIGAEAVSTANIANLGVTAAKLAAEAVETGKIKNEAVTEGKLGNLAVTAAKIANLAVTEGKLGNEAVTAAKIANLTITGGKIANETITGGKIANETIPGSKLAGTEIFHGAYKTANEPGFGPTKYSTTRPTFVSVMIHGNAGAGALCVIKVEGVKVGEWEQSAGAQTGKASMYFILPANESWVLESPNYAALVPVEVSYLVL